MSHRKAHRRRLFLQSIHTFSSFLMAGALAQGAFADTPTGTTTGSGTAAGAGTTAVDPHQDVVVQAHTIAASALKTAAALQAAGANPVPAVAGACLSWVQPVTNAANLLTQQADEYQAELARVISNGQVCDYGSIGVGLADTAAGMYLNSQGNDYTASLQQSTLQQVLGLAGPGVSLMLELSKSKSDGASNGSATMAGLSSCASAGLAGFKVMTDDQELNSISSNLATDKQTLANLEGSSSSDAPIYVGTASPTPSPSVDPNQQQEVQDAVNLLQDAKMAETVATADWGAVSLFCAYNCATYVINIPGEETSIQTNANTLTGLQNQALAACPPANASGGSATAIAANTKLNGDTTTGKTDSAGAAKTEAQEKVNPTGGGLNVQNLTNQAAPAANCLDTSTCGLESISGSQPVTPTRLQFVAPTH